MKTFDEKDLITWANRDKAEVGNKGYFADSITDLHSNMKADYVHELMSIFDNNNRCFSDGTFSYGFFLPVDAVKEEKTYRPCKTIKEFYEAVNNYGSDSFPNEDFTDENFMYNLLGTNIHIRNAKSGIEYHLNINGISTDLDGTRNVLIGNTYLSFKALFDNSEIELNGKWVPFGVLE